MWLGSYMSNSNKIQSFLVPRIQNPSNLTQFGSLNFNWNYVPNFEKLQWENLFLISIHTHPYFIWKILSTKAHFWPVQIRIDLKIICIIKKTLCRRGRPTGSLSALLSCHWPPTTRRSSPFVPGGLPPPRAPPQPAAIRVVPPPLPSPISVAQELLVTSVLSVRGEGSEFLLQRFPSGFSSSSACVTPPHRLLA
jgi:hypothetical protein